MAIAAAAHGLIWQKYILHERSWIAEGKGEFALLRVLGERGPLMHPIVVPDIHVYAPIWFYGTEAVRDNLLFVWKYDAMVVTALSTESRQFFKAMDFQEFVSEERTFYFYESGRRTPLLAAFLERGAVACDSGLLDTSETYPRPGYLYKVRLRALGADPARGATRRWRRRPPAVSTTPGSSDEDQTTFITTCFRSVM